MQIYVVKLMNGEEIIGTSEEEIDNDFEYINLSNVYTIQTSYDVSNPNAKTYLSPFMIYCTNELFTFHRRGVILYSSPSEEMIEYYLGFLDDMRIARESHKHPKSTRRLQ